MQACLEISRAAVDRRDRERWMRADDVLLGARAVGRGVILLLVLERQAGRDKARALRLHRRFVQFEQEGNLRRIFATIVVDKSSQKAIIIGTKGERLKRIGTDARKDMEVTFAAKVYLELFVRVKKGWADNEAMLRQYGYE